MLCLYLEGVNLTSICHAGHITSALGGLVLGMLSVNPQGCGMCVGCCVCLYLRMYDLDVCMYDVCMYGCTDVRMYGCMAVWMFG
jgi:hypothetical protein